MFQKLAWLQMLRLDITYWRVLSLLPIQPVIENRSTHFACGWLSVAVAESGDAERARLGDRELR